MCACNVFVKAWCRRTKRKKGKKQNNEPSLKRYKLSVLSLKRFTDLHFIKVFFPKGDQKPLLLLKGLSVVFEWWLDSVGSSWRVHMEDTSFFVRDKISAGSKCQKAPHFSASELGCRGRLAALQSISRHGEERGFTVHADSFFCCRRRRRRRRCPLLLSASSLLFPPPESRVFFLYFFPMLDLFVLDCWLIRNKQLRFPPGASAASFALVSLKMEMVPLLYMSVSLLFTSLLLWS